MAQEIEVNFGSPMPVFPLPDFVLLPHAVQPLHIFEPRYRRLVSDCLDRSGQFALATFRCDQQKHSCDARPALRPVVCVGQIVQHEPLPDGRHIILLHGVCRARIVELIEPDDDCMYRAARLRPIEGTEDAPAPMPGVREELRTLLAGPRLSRMRGVDNVMGWFDREDVSTNALLELIGFALIQDTELKYRLLAEDRVARRAELIRAELVKLDRLVRRTERQGVDSWPKGMSWN
ncbi:MAG: LON peptidase substrate-binding domain-containing protein [Planctomycetota bacterium]|jgi:Lon protease-like protein